MKEPKILEIKTKLSELAKDFKIKIEADAYHDVFHDGYSESQILAGDWRIPKGFEDIQYIFPSVLGRSFEELERAGWAKKIEDTRIEALVNSLEKIDLLGGGAEYQNLAGEWVSEKAGVLEVSVDSANDEITLKIQNPHHLLNAIIQGVGLYAPDIDEEASVSDLAAKLHLLKDYFSVWGESMASDEVDRHFSPDIDDEELADSLSSSLQDLSFEEVCESALDCIRRSDDQEDEGLDDETVFSFISKHTPFSKEAVSRGILDLLKKRVNESSIAFQEFKTRLGIDIDPNQKLLEEKLQAFNSFEGPRVGDFVIINNEYQRFSHDWGDSLQTSEGGSFHLGDSGRISFSGGLNPSIQKDQLEDTGEVKSGKIWFFKNNRPEKENGIEFEIEFRVYKLK